MSVPVDALPPPARITEQQRLGATLTLSLLVHGLLILGVGFAVGGNAPLVPTLDVIFSQTSTPLTPEQADFLAQANQQGGVSWSPPHRHRRRRAWSAAPKARRWWPRRSRGRCPNAPSRTRR